MKLQSTGPVNPRIAMDPAREGKSYANVGEAIMYVDVVEIDEFVIVEAGVLLLDSILLALQGPLPLEGAGLDFLDPLGVLPRRPLCDVDVDDPLILRLAPCPNLLPSSPFSPFPAGSMGVDGSGHGPSGFQGRVARNLPTYVRVKNVSFSFSSLRLSNADR